MKNNKKDIGICNICGIGLAILVAPLFLSSCHHSFSWTLTLRSICHGTPLGGLFHKIPFLIRSWVLRICPLFSTSPSAFDSAPKGASFSPDFDVEMIADVVSGGWLDDSWLIVLVFRDVGVIGDRSERTNARRGSGRAQVPAIRWIGHRPDPLLFFFHYCHAQRKDNLRVAAR